MERKRVRQREELGKTCRRMKKRRSVERRKDNKNRLVEEMKERKDEGKDYFKETNRWRK